MELNADYDYSFNYQNWYPSVEHLKVITQLKMLVCLNFLLFLNMKFEEKKRMRNYKDYVQQTSKNEIGKCTYTHMLNEGAGIETDLTVVCIEKDSF